MGAHTFNAEDVRRKERERRDDLAAAAQAQKEAEEAQELEDDEDERLWQELQQPIQPKENLASFMPYQSGSPLETSKIGIPGQIERLYQDINSMIISLGLNARALLEFIAFQKGQDKETSWPDVLESETPEDALNGDWVLADIERLDEGTGTLEKLLRKHHVEDAARKVHQCQDILTKDVIPLRTNLSSVRKTIQTSTAASSALNTHLSPEQQALQNELRKSVAHVQAMLGQTEQNLSVLRAKLAESTTTSNLSPAAAGKSARSSPQKKPTVEAVTNTIAKMTSMAEKKSSDIDFLESQLRKLNVVVDDAKVASEYSTPQRQLTSRSSAAGRTPASNAGSIYHTPDSKFAGSTRGTLLSGRITLRESTNGTGYEISADDRERWQKKRARKQAVSEAIKKVLAERRAKHTSGGGMRQGL